MAAGAVFCSNCGQVFLAAPRSGADTECIGCGPMEGAAAAIHAYTGYAAVPRVEYAGILAAILGVPH